MSACVCMQITVLFQQICLSVCPMPEYDMSKRVDVSSHYFDILVGAISF